MNHVIISASLWIISMTNGIVITPNAVNQYVSVSLTPDSRGLNGIVDNAWELHQRVGNTLNDWGLLMTLDSTEYGFESGAISSLSISLCGYCEPGPGSQQCDPFFAFSIGDEEYFIFATDLDGGLQIEPGGDAGSFIYPKCQSTNSLISGSPIGLIPDNGLNSLGPFAFRRALGGGDFDNYDQLTSTVNGESFPLRFEFINDDNADSFLFRFSSPTFPAGLECEFASAVGTDKDFKLYFTPDMQDEGVIIESIAINDEPSDPLSCEDISTPAEPICDDYLYIDEVSTYEAARDRCIAEGGTLATITNDNCDCVKDALDGKEAAWIGLNSLDNEKPPFFVFEDGSDCPTEYNGKYGGACLAPKCWANGKPINCDENGSLCVGIGSNGIINDVQCEEERNGILCNIGSGALPDAKFELGLNILGLNDENGDKPNFKDFPLMVWLQFGAIVLLILGLNLCGCYYCLCRNKYKDQSINSAAVKFV